MKKLLSMVLAFALMLSLMIVPASAKEYDCSVTVTPSVTSVTESATEQTVTFTIKLITKEAKPIKSFSFELDPSDNLTLATSGKAEDTFKYTTNKALKYDEEEGTGIFNTYAYNGTTKVLAAYGAEGDGITSETVVLTIMGKIAANATGSATLGLKDVVVGPDGSSQYINVSKTEATVTINAAPVALTGTASISGTAKCGETLTASLSDTNNSGTLSYKWYRGNDVISGATKSTYTLTADDVGKTIKVQISSSVQTGSKTSDATSAVAKADAPSAPSCNFSFDGPNPGNLMGSTTAMEYSLDGGKTWADCTENMALTGENITADKDIVVRVKETATTSAGTAQIIDITKATTPNLEVTQPTTIGGTGSVATTTAHQYSANGTNWTDCTGTKTDLAVGTYYVRVKASGTTLASAAQTVTITAFNPNKEATPTATFTATGDSTGTLKNVTNGMKYSTNGTTWTNINSTSVNLTGLSAGTIKVYKLGNGTTTADSDQQTINVSKASTPNLTVTQPTAIGGTGSVATTTAHQYSANGTNWTDCTGTKTDLAVGTYYVRVKASGTTLASAAQTVTITAFTPVSVTGVSLNKSSTTIKVGNSETLSATVAPANATNKNVTWSSSNTSVATVDENGKVTGVAEGTATITVTTADGSKTATCSVTVEKSSTPVNPPVGPSTPAVTVPVNGNENSIEVSASVSGSTADVREIKDTELAKVSSGGKVEIDLTGLKKDIDTAKIPTETVKKIADKDGMSVKLTTATVTFDKTATQEIASQTDGNTIQLVVDDVKELSLNAVQKEAVKKLDTAIIIDAYLISDGTKLCTEGKGGFGGGKATVILPYEIKNNRTAANYSVYYLDDAGKLEKLNTKYDARLGAFVFDIEHFSKYIVAYNENAMVFADVPATSYYYDAVLWAAENNITKGTDATHFSPTAPVTRAQVVTLLWRAAGSPVVNYAMNFSDVSGDAYYTEAVRWAVSEGITKGTSGTAFSPDAVCTRGQIVTFLARFAGVEDAETASAFSDVNATDYFAAAVKWAKDNKVTEGTSATTFSPYEDCTRAQVVTFLYRWMVK